MTELSEPGIVWTHLIYRFHIFYGDVNSVIDYSKVEQFIASIWLSKIQIFFLVALIETFIDF